MSGRDRSPRVAELTWGLLVLAVGMGYVWQARRIPTSLLDDAVGPSGVPMLLGGAVLALGIVYMARFVLRRRATMGGDESLPAGEATVASLRAPVATLLMGVVYGAMLPILGYAVSIFLLLAAMSAYHAGGLRREGAGVAVLGAVVFWGLFVWLLGIPQPAGVWTVAR